MSGEAIVVRSAVAEDLPVVMRFIRDLAAYEHLTEACVATEAQIGAALFGSPVRLHALLAETSGRSVGLAVWLHMFSTYAGRPCLYLEDLFVDPAFRRRGVAGHLLRALACRAVAEGCALVEWKVLDWNEPALRLYKRLGAKPVEGWISQRLSGPDLVALAA